MCVGDKVHLISDYLKEQKELSKNAKIVVDISVTAIANSPIEAVCDVDGQEFRFVGEVLQEAKNSPLSLHEIDSCFKKSEYFDAYVSAETDHAFITKSSLNEFRRMVFDSLYKELTKSGRAPLEKKCLDKVMEGVPISDVQFIDKCCDKFDAQLVVYDPECYIEEDILEVKNKVESSSRRFALNLPNFALESDIAMLKKLVEKNDVAIFVQNLYALNFNTQKYIGAGMNVYNNYAVSYFDLPYMTAEKGNNTMPYMTMRHCPIKEHIGGGCNNCKFDNNYCYAMQNGKKLRLKRKKMSSCTFYLVD